MIRIQFKLLEDHKITMQLRANWLPLTQTVTRSLIVGLLRIVTLQLGLTWAHYVALTTLLLIILNKN